MKRPEPNRVGGIRPTSPVLCGCLLCDEAKDLAQGAEVLLVVHKGRRFLFVVVADVYLEDGSHNVDGRTVEHKEGDDGARALMVIERRRNIYSIDYATLVSSAGGYSPEEVESALDRARKEFVS